jgi:hypothetical protein
VFFLKSLNKIAAKYLSIALFVMTLIFYPALWAGESIAHSLPSSDLVQMAALPDENATESIALANFDLIPSACF